MTHLIKKNTNQSTKISFDKVLKPWLGLSYFISLVCWSLLSNKRQCSSNNGFRHCHDRCLCHCSSCWLLVTPEFPQFGRSWSVVMVAQDASLSADLTAICPILPAPRMPRHCQLFDHCRFLFDIKWSVLTMFFNKLYNYCCRNVSSEKELDIFLSLLYKTQSEFTKYKNYINGIHYLQLCIDAIISN